MCRKGSRPPPKALTAMIECAMIECAMIECAMIASISDWGK
jgi:hypothetical protein